MTNGNNALAMIKNPRKIEVPLVRVVTGVGVGLIEVAAEVVDERRNKLSNDITAAQNIVPVVGTIVGIGMSLLNNDTARNIGNDIAVSFGAIATLKLANVARNTIALRKLKKLRELSIVRGGGVVSNKGGSPAIANRITTMSIA